MKKIIIIIAIISIAIVSCKKEEITIEKSKDLTSKKYISTGGSGWTELVFVDNKYDCKYTGQTCAPEVVITPSQKPVIERFFEVITTNNQQNIRNLFIDQRQEIAEFVAIEIVDATINGEVIVTSSILAELNKKIMIFTNNTTKEVEVAYPFIIK